MGVCSFFIVKLRIFVVVQIISAICNAHPHLTADGKLEHSPQIASELETDLEERFITPIEVAEDTNANEADVDEHGALDNKHLPFLSEVKHVKDTFIQPVKLGNIVLLSKVNVEKKAYEEPISSESSEENPELFYRQDAVADESKQFAEIRKLANKPVQQQSSAEIPEHRFHGPSDIYRQPVQLGNINLLSKLNVMQPEANDKSSSEESESRSEPDSLSDEDVELRSPDAESRSGQDEISETYSQPMRSRLSYHDVYAHAYDQPSSVSDDSAPLHDAEIRVHKVSDVYEQPVKLGNLALLSKVNTIPEKPYDDSSLEESESRSEPNSLSDEEEELDNNDRFFVGPRIFSESKNLENGDELISNSEDGHTKSHVLVSSRMFKDSRKPVEVNNVGILSKVNSKLHEITVEPASEEDDVPNARIPLLQEDIHSETEDEDASVSLRNIHVYYPPVEYDAANSSNQGLSLQARIFPDQGSADFKSRDLSEDKAKVNAINQHEQMPLDNRRLSHHLHMQDVFEQPVQMGNLAVLSKVNTNSMNNGINKQRSKSRKSHRKSKQKHRKLKKSKKQKSSARRNKKHHHKHSHKHVHSEAAAAKSRLTKYAGLQGDQEANSFFTTAFQNANHGHSQSKYAKSDVDSKFTKKMKHSNARQKAKIFNAKNSPENQHNYFSDNFGSMKHRENSKTYSSQESSEQQQQYFQKKVEHENQDAFSADHRQTEESREDNQHDFLSSNLGDINHEVSSTHHNNNYEDDSKQSSHEQQQNYFEDDVESMQHGMSSHQQQKNSKHLSTQDSREQEQHYSGNYITSHGQNSQGYPLHNTREHHLNYFEGNGGMRNVGTLEQNTSNNNMKNSQNYLLKNVGNAQEDSSSAQQNSELDSSDQQKYYLIKEIGHTKHDLLHSNHPKNCKVCGISYSGQQGKTIFVTDLGNIKQGLSSISHQHSTKSDSSIDSDEQQKHFVKKLDSHLSAEDVEHLKLDKDSSKQQTYEKLSESNKQSEGFHQFKVNSVGDGRRPLIQMDEEAVGKSQAFTQTQVHGQGAASNQVEAQAQANSQTFSNSQLHAQGQPEALSVLFDKNNTQGKVIASSQQHVAEDLAKSDDIETTPDPLASKDSQQLKSVSSPKQRSRFPKVYVDNEESSEEREDLPWKIRYHSRPKQLVYGPIRYYKHRGGIRKRPHYWLRHSPSLRFHEENEPSEELDSRANEEDLLPDSPVSSRIEKLYAEVRRKAAKASDAVSPRMLSPKYHHEEYKNSYNIAQRSDARSFESSDLTANQLLYDDSDSKILQAVSSSHTRGPNPLLQLVYSRVLPHDSNNDNNLRPFRAQVSHNRTVVRQSVKGAPGRVHLHVTNDNTQKVDDKTIASNMHVEVDGNKEDEGFIISNLKDVLYKIQKFILSANIESKSKNLSPGVGQQNLHLSSSRSPIQKDPVKYYIYKKLHGKYEKPVVVTAAATKKVVKSGDEKQSQERMSNVPPRFLDKHNLAKLERKASDSSEELDSVETTTLDYKNPNNQLYIWPSPNPSELDYIIEDRVATLRQFTYEFNRLVEDLSNFSLAFRSKTDIFGEAVRKSLLDFTNLKDMESIIADAQNLMDHLRRLILNIVNDVGAALQYLLTQPNYAIGEVVQNMSAGLVTLVGQLPQIVTKSIEWTHTRQLRSLQ